MVRTYAFNPSTQHTTACMPGAKEATAAASFGSFPATSSAFGGSQRFSAAFLSRRDDDLGRRRFDPMDPAGARDFSGFPPNGRAENFGETRRSDFGDSLRRREADGYGEPIRQSEWPPNNSLESSSNSSGFKSLRSQSTEELETRAFRTVVIDGQRYLQPLDESINRRINENFRRLGNQRSFHGRPSRERSAVPLEERFVGMAVAPRAPSNADRWAAAPRPFDSNGIDARDFRYNAPYGRDSVLAGRERVRDSAYGPRHSSFGARDAYSRPDPQYGAADGFERRCPLEGHQSRGDRISADRREWTKRCGRFATSNSEPMDRRPADYPDRQLSEPNYRQYSARRPGEYANARVDYPTLPPMPQRRPYGDERPILAFDPLLRSNASLQTMGFGEWPPERDPRRRIGPNTTGGVHTTTDYLNNSIGATSLYQPEPYPAYAPLPFDSGFQASPAFNSAAYAPLPNTYSSALNPLSNNINTIPLDATPATVERQEKERHRQELLQQIDDNRRRKMLEKQKEWDEDRRQQWRSQLTFQRQAAEVQREHEEIRHKQLDAERRAAEAQATVASYRTKREEDRDRVGPQLEWWERKPAWADREAASPAVPAVAHHEDNRRRPPAPASRTSLPESAASRRSRPGFESVAIHAATPPPRRSASTGAASSVGSVASRRSSQISSVPSRTQSRVASRRSYQPSIESRGRLSQSTALRRLSDTRHRLDNEYRRVRDAVDRNEYDDRVFD